MSPDTAWGFAVLFLGRTDAYGTWGGGCERTAPFPIGQWLYDLHLAGDRLVGIYPALDTDACWWGCVDIDVDDQATAINLQTALSTRGIKAWTERTKRGHHVWVFAAEPVPLATMRRALQATCKVVGYTPKEVNPKQSHLGPGELGNYVRLPYPGGNAATERYMYEHDGSGVCVRLTVEDFVSRALASLASPDSLSLLASLWVEPVSKFAGQLGSAIARGTIEEIERLNATLKTLPGLAWTIYAKGPLDGSDRSSTMARLGHLMADDGYSAADIFLVLRAAPWQKFAGRTDEDQRIMEIVERL